MIPQKDSKKKQKGKANVLNKFHYCGRNDFHGVVVDTMLTVSN